MQMRSTKVCCLPSCFRYRTASRQRAYNICVERKVFWTTFTILGLIADVTLPLWLGLVATIPIGFASWWIAYRSDWF